MDLCLESSRYPGEKHHHANQAAQGRCVWGRTHLQVMGKKSSLDRGMGAGETVPPWWTQAAWRRCPVGVPAGEQEDTAPGEQVMGRDPGFS